MKSTGGLLFIFIAGLSHLQEGGILAIGDATASEQGRAQQNGDATPVAFDQGKKALHSMTSWTIVQFLA